MTETANALLIVDDDKGIQRQLKWAFDDYAVQCAGDADTALALFRTHRPPVVTIDLGLPPDPDGTSEGFRVLDAVLKAAPTTKVIVMTGNEGREHALRAIAAGAYDYYQKPIDRDEFGLILKRAFHLCELEDENRRLARAQRDTPLSGVITADLEMLRLCRQVEKVAPSDVRVLLLGESGTGKELLARALHELGNRADKTFHAINCAAIPENLLESELFGHEKGAFTGAIRQTKGKVELADGGTLFLDEIGDIPLSVQVKLLRFLQERVIERIGGRAIIPVDARIVCATNQNLERLIQDGLFREDLYYRLSEMVLTIPPLRDRPGDAELIASALLTRFNEDQNGTVRGFSGDALAAIAGHNWPGNVRELENRVKRAVIMAEENRIGAADLDLVEADDETEVRSLAEVREEAEKREIPRALARAEGNVSRAAKLLGISRPTLYDLMRQHSIRDD